MSVDYDSELNTLEELVRRIEYILGNRTTYPKHVEDIQDRIVKYRERIMEIMNAIDQVHGNLDGTESQMKDANDEIFKLRKQYKLLVVLVEVHFRNLTNIFGKGPQDARNKTRRSLEISNMALDLAKGVRQIVEQSADERANVMDKIARYDPIRVNILDRLSKYERDFKNLNGIVGQINELLCGKNATSCGGCTPFGCENCGGGEACDGAVSLASKAVEKARQAERALWQKERKFEKSRVAFVKIRLLMSASFSSFHMRNFDCCEEICCCEELFFNATLKKT